MPLPTQNAMPGPSRRRRHDRFHGSGLASARSLRATCRRRDASRVPGVTPRIAMVRLDHRDDRFGRPGAS